MATQEERVAEMEQRLVAQEDAVRAERETLEEEIRAQLTKQFEGRDRLHQEEVEGLTREWQLERQVGADFISPPNVYITNTWLVPGITGGYTARWARGHYKIHSGMKLRFSHELLHQFS